MDGRSSVRSSGKHLLARKHFLAGKQICPRVPNPKNIVDISSPCPGYGCNIPRKPVSCCGPTAESPPEGSAGLCHNGEIGYTQVIDNAVRAKTPPLPGFAKLSRCFQRMRKILYAPHTFLPGFINSQTNTRWTRNDGREWTRETCVSSLPKGSKDGHPLPPWAGSRVWDSQYAGLPCGL